MRPHLVLILTALLAGGCTKKDVAPPLHVPLATRHDAIATDLNGILREKKQALVFFSGSGTFLCDSNRKMLIAYSSAHPEWPFVEVPVGQFGERAAQWGVDAVPTTLVVSGRKIVKKKVGLLLSFEEVDRLVSLTR